MLRPGCVGWHDLADLNRPKDLARVSNQGSLSAQSLPRPQTGPQIHFPSHGGSPFIPFVIHAKKGPKKRTNLSSPSAPLPPKVQRRTPPCPQPIPPPAAQKAGDSQSFRASTLRLGGRREILARLFVGWTPQNDATVLRWLPFKEPTKKGGNNSKKTKQKKREPYGCGSKLNNQGTAGSSPCFHPPGLNFGYLCLAT